MNKAFDDNSSKNHGPCKLYHFEIYEMQAALPFSPIFQQKTHRKN